MIANTFLNKLINGKETKRRVRGAYFNALISKIERKYRTQGIWLYRRINSRPHWLLKVQGTKKDGYGYIEVGSGDSLEKMLEKVIGKTCPACDEIFKTKHGMAVHFARCKFRNK